ncbi:hypothetical protein [Oceaniglobus roseus]|uniref:hypothetical protein n=1 Tax=Oceaniglobus roseus TaxID=1737570 RepID=UPI000C7F6D8A|nr:hypothetical protein [Kandeliimicrobium roseum]
MRDTAPPPPGWEDILSEGEEILWQGQPVRGLRQPLQTIALSVFGLPFLAGGLACSGAGLLGLFAPGLSPHRLEAAIALVFGLPFIATGALMVFGTWYKALTAHRNVFYTLTNRRGYIATQFWKRRLTSFPIGPAGAVSLDTGRRGDTVWFAEQSRRAGKRGYTTVRIGFEDIADGAAVWRLIRGLQDRQSA